ncbi:MAG: CehA/McbA family metallohydrolase [Prosthecobacter sp.]|uniref:CehA/McbA family metallohydrolase n=1 Tax=Prosthecobacter sp. TaxID=1965333 RepID=UPI0025CDF085|nr:CehA/McbA family metallohydrolase [Prosthecobacter sp.]MCF7786955.1 CehA/McbA family metallohydrolase [Prosthecobacter sp.]
MKTSLLLCLCFAFVHLSHAAPLEPQPFFTATQRLIDATAFLGSPFSTAELTTLRACIKAHDAASVAKAQTVLDSHALFLVTITPEQRVKVERGAAKAVLDESGWRQYLVRVENEAGVTAKLAASSPQGKEVYVKGSPPVAPHAQPRDPGLPPLSARWLELQMHEAPPQQPTLSGLGVEYRIIQLYASEAGKREAVFSFDTGQGTQDLGFRAETSVLFDCQPARDVALNILDENGKPCIAELLIKDHAGRIYPSQIKRIAPDFFFHPQIYRGDGEILKLPDGDYDITFRRGPESIPEQRKLKIAGKNTPLKFQVQRWIDPSKLGWWSGDHHIHAAGCAHYSVPTMGVHAPDMARHCMGEDLKIGANLTWGPCFDYQKQFFTGTEDKESKFPFLLRYDVEVSGFGSHKSGHLCLLKLKEQMYPGGDSTAHWPTLCLNTLKWAKKQGALCGPAHSGWGLQPLAENDPARKQNYKLGIPSATDELPNYIIPPFNGIGANEYIVDVTHNVEGPDGKPVPAVDFLSMVDTPHTWELNIWYHTLNAGFRTRISGETDFPCIYGERVGLGRAYVKLDGRLSYDAWCEGIRAGRAYVSDGKSHLMEFKARQKIIPEGPGATPHNADRGPREIVMEPTEVGTKDSEIRLQTPGTLRLSAKVAARLDDKLHPEIQSAPVDHKPFWDLERARRGASHNVPVEVIVNGVSVAQKNITADGVTREMSFDVPVTKSCWVALRIRASSHTNPIFVIVAGKPIREKRSLEWCLKSVDQCWSQKEALIDPKEHSDAVAAYEHARQVYRERLAE